MYYGKGFFVVKKRRNDFRQSELFLAIRHLNFIVINMMSDIIMDGC